MAQLFSFCDGFSTKSEKNWEEIHVVILCPIQEWQRLWGHPLCYTVVLRCRWDKKNHGVWVVPNYDTSKKNQYALIRAFCGRQGWKRRPSEGADFDILALAMKGQCAVAPAVFLQLQNVATVAELEETMCLFRAVQLLDLLHFVAIFHVSSLLSTGV